jgi:hypothetical protein
VLWGVGLGIYNHFDDHIPWPGPRVMRAGRRYGIGTPVTARLVDELRTREAKRSREVR